MAEGIIKDKDIISNGAVAAPREFFMKLHDIRIHLIRIQNEGDAHSNAVATKAIKILDDALAPAYTVTENIPC